MTAEPFIDIQVPPAIDTTNERPTGGVAQQIVNMVMRWFKLAQYRRDTELRRMAMWKECWEYYTGDTWKGYPPKVPRVGGNICESLVDTNTSVLTAMRPEFSTRALSEDGEFVAGIVDDLMHYLWQKRGFLVPEQMAVNGQGIYGVSFAKVRWDMSIDDIVWEYVRPGDVYVDPLATSMENCRYLIHVTLQPRREVEAQYNVKVTDSTSLVNTTATGGNVPGEYVRVVECWYDWGTKVARVCGEQLLFVGDNMIGMFPYARFSHKEVENLFYPPGIIESVKRMQKEYQETRAAAHASIRYYWAPKSRVSNPANRELMRSNQPGLCLVCEDGEANWLPPPPISPILITRPENLRLEMELQTGINEVTQGRRPQNVPSAAGIQQLTQSSQSRIQSHAPALEKAIARLGEITLRYIKLNYSDDRILPFLDQEKRLEFQMMSQPIDQFSPPRTLMDIIKTTPVEIVVQGGSTLNRSEGAMAALALQLFNAHAVDAEWVLDILKVEKRKEVTARMAAKVPELMGLAQGGQSGGATGGEPQGKQGGSSAGMPDLKNVSTERLQQMYASMRGKGNG